MRTRKVGAGTGMIMGAGVGIVFAPILGPFGIVLGAGIGLVIGTAISRHGSPADDPFDSN